MDDVERQRLLELLEAREARRAKLRSWWPAALAAVLLGGIGGAYWWDHVQEQRAEEQRVCQMFSDMAGTDGESC